MSGQAISCVGASARRRNSLGLRPSAPAILLRWWLVAAVFLASVALGLMVGSPIRSLADMFLVRQDLPMLAMGAILLCLSVAGGSSARIGSPFDLKSRSGLILVWAVAALALAAALAGWRWVFFRYPLSMDEYMAGFDAAALREGRLLAPVPPVWRPFVPAMQPSFGLLTGDHAVWRSDYLPLNAAWQALCAAAGGPALSGALASAVSLLLVYDLARQLWPRRPDAAVAAALFLASSAQFLLTSMTAYAMPAHLALNCLWLWLYRRERRWSDGASLAVGWAACGLHQLVFPLLFSAPFVAELWLRRRWRRAAVFTLGYGLIALFWILFWPVVFSIGRLHAPEGKAGGLTAFAALVIQLLRSGDALLSLRLMAENLVRFITWQNPLCVALLLAGFPAAMRRPGPLRGLTAGLVLTVAVSALIMPYQGHGWGYRYLHGLLGGASLIAAGAYVDLTETTWPAAAAWRSLQIAVAGVLLVLLPWRIAQVRAFVRPYAQAHQAILASGADAVVVDGRGVPFGDDLVRNGPDFFGRPFVFALSNLPSDRLRQVCRLKRIEFFDIADARRFGLATDGAAPLDPYAASLRERLQASGCGERHVAAVPAS